MFKVISVTKNLLECDISNCAIYLHHRTAVVNKVQPQRTLISADISSLMQEMQNKKKQLKTWTASVNDHFSLDLNQYNSQGAFTLVRVRVRVPAYGFQ